MKTMATRKLTADEQALVLRARGLIRLAKMKHTGLVRVLGEPEAESSAALALCQAAIRFDPEKGKFSTYAMAYIWGTWMSQVTRQRSIQPLDLDVPDRHVPEAVLEDEASLLLAAVSRLNPIHQRAVRRCVMDGVTLETAAREFGVTKEAIRQARDRGLANLRRILAKRQEA